MASEVSPCCLFKIFLLLFVLCLLSLLEFLQSNVIYVGETVLHYLWQKNPLLIVPHRFQHT